VRRSTAWLAALAVVWFGAVPAGAASNAPRPRYAIRASVDFAGHTIAGSVAIEVTNTSRHPLDHVLLHLYPNRFRADGDEVNDVTRPHVYPRLAFDPGGIEVSRVVAAAAGHELGLAPAGDATSLADATALDVKLDAALAPGERTRLEVTFSTRVPQRYGPFGVTDDGLTAVAGWYPYLAALDAAGEWRLNADPPAADVEADVSLAADMAAVVGSDVFPVGHADPIHAQASDVRTFAVIAFVDGTIASVDGGGTPYTFVAAREHYANRIGFGPDPAELLQSTVESAVAHRPASVPAPKSLTVVSVPLRWNLVTPADGLVVVSDRALHVNELLRGYHEAQIAQAVYAELLRRRILACEPAGERQLALQALAWNLADRWLHETRPGHHDVHDWIDWFDLFAIVDRFETAPKVPFVDAFFPNATTDDALRESVFSYAGRRAPPRLVLARLQRDFGADTVNAAVDIEVSSLGGARCTDLEQSLARASGKPAADVAPKLAAAEVAPSSNSIVDPSLRPPDERSRYQLVLDTADIEVSSSEIGLAALFVARERGDYTKDFAINPYLTERSYGVNAGPRLHFGERNDPNTYRQNLMAFATYAGLDSGFKDDRFPDLRNHGHIVGTGLRYDYSNVYFYDNPTNQREARLFADWYDTAFGSDFGFTRFGARVSATTPLGSALTVGAVEVLAGFEEPISSSGVPVQEQYSLGGRRALRGVSVNERLGRNIGLARFELRREVLPDWDLDFLDIVTYRHTQLHLFLDTGQVDNSAGHALNPEHFALGTGIGLNAVYDFLGFFPARAYLELATRLDRDQTGFQVLFGTRQAF
jgi:hypothetical protein